MYSLSRGLVAELVGPGLHLVQAGPVGIDVGDGAGRAGIGTGRLAAAQVALLDLAGFLHVVDRAERAADGADLAADAGAVVDHLGAGHLVERDRFDRAGVQAPGFVALRAGVGHLATGVMEVEHLDAALGRRVGGVVLEGTGHFTLEAPGALLRVDVQGLLHVCPRYAAAFGARTIARPFGQTRLSSVGLRARLPRPNPNRTHTPTPRCPPAWPLRLRRLRQVS